VDVYISLCWISTTPNSDDSSIIDDLSFDYICDADGHIVCHVVPSRSPVSNVLNGQIIISYSGSSRWVE